MFVIVVLEILGKPYTIVNLYKTPPFTKGLFERTMGMALEIAEGPLLIAINFNTVLGNSLDRFGGSTLPLYAHIQTNLIL